VSKGKAKSQELTANRNILEGKGYGLADARPSVYIVHSIRNKKPIGKTGEYHPFI
jgi:UDP-N-acetyl-2-amino-2-deoxyglucuronate dehydrogenase